MFCINVLLSSSYTACSVITINTDKIIKKSMLCGIYFVSLNVLIIMQTCITPDVSGLFMKCTLKMIFKTLDSCLLSAY